MQHRKASWKQVTGLAGIEGHWLRRKHFTPQLLAQVAEHIGQSEAGHSGELMLAIEAVSPRHEPDSRLRALEVFGRLRVWDTPLDTGVLLYLALDKHHIHIVADRGVTASDDLWQAVCERLQERLKRKDYGPGLLAAIEDIEEILSSHCPPLPLDGDQANNLPDAPVML
ncbi:TPM domain-containing protein [Pollutimonas thiosulfatoxidans]|uniref:TPM domain-containing protein n=1 Tax=Pollutimonas thiosulfatoxidans TaxID=2028345 RepID=A0A410GEV6_9BURK|nr:TPM domain-containing protein [Pollutimonas thiosulfatoxidans]MBF6616943.1 TPM domain-containing protein [Candidimonas sp.]NYT45767.1 TPM domain-containing protein [Alcaligenaceae bacterium]QAA94832.1 hypothetical protein CKA81_13965 [Pollutimonas thiosulfatoxidans]